MPAVCKRPPPISRGYGYRKALIVTDKILNQIGVVAKLTTLLAEHGIESVVFDETKCSPPRKMKNVFAKNENPPQR